MTEDPFNTLLKLGKGMKKAEEWMGRLWLAAVECNYKEIDRQLKEQFIHGLNDTQMLTEIINELTKAEENAKVTSYHMLTWTKWVEAQKTQSAVIYSPREMKEFDKIQTVGDEQKQKGRKLHAPVKMPMM